MKVVLTLRAAADVDEIAAYVCARNPGAARRIEAELQAAFRLIGTYPFAGRQTRRGVRRFTMHRFPYLIFYEIDERAGEVRVFTVRHGRRREEQSLVER